MDVRVATATNCAPGVIAMALAKSEETLPALMIPHRMISFCCEISLLIEDDCGSSFGHFENDLNKLKEGIVIITLYRIPKKEKLLHQF